LIVNYSFYPQPFYCVIILSLFNGGSVMGDKIKLSDKKRDWSDYTTEELRSRLRKLERSLIRYNDDAEPDPEEINSLKFEIANREEKEE